MRFLKMQTQVWAETGKCQIFSATVCYKQQLAIAAAANCFAAEQKQQHTVLQQSRSSSRWRANSFAEEQKQQRQTVLQQQQVELLPNGAPQFVTSSRQQQQEMGNKLFCSRVAKAAAGGAVAQRSPRRQPMVSSTSTLALAVDLEYKYSE